MAPSSRANLPSRLLLPLFPHPILLLFHSSPSTQP
uniref:Uncharacterized protein n=1 Tax=Arundo donax TaxID=35708 RepID=A0A0A9BRA5_ARUDO